MLTFALLALLSPAALGANILGVFPITSVSHQVVYRNLMQELNRRGHSVTVITPDPVRDPALRNYREIDMSYYYDEWRRGMIADPRKLKLSQKLPELLYLTFKNSSSHMCHSYLSSPQVQAFLKERPQFDLLVIEFGFTPCFYGFAKLSGFRLAGVLSLQTHPIVYSNLGNPIDASYLPDVNFPLFKNLTFYQRLRTFLFQVFGWLFYSWIMPEHDSIARKYFGDDLPHLVDIERNLSLMMVNAHFSMGFPRPLGPNTVEIGGPAFHLIGKKPKPLPKELKDFLDDAPNGVIYFSLGTNVKTNNISSKVEEILMESFGRVRQKVLWKWENENLRVNLKNVKVGRWFPQVDVLAHPNVRAFVTQGGLQSVGEAMEFRVPMVVMPFFADQGHNARKMELEGVALNLDFDALDADTFTAALNDIVSNRKYRDNMARFSALVRDQPVPPLEKAVWWTEYVIRHNGAPHLRSAAATMPWYQYLMLDVLAVILLAAVLLLYLAYSGVRFLLGRVVKPKRD